MSKAVDIAADVRAGRRSALDVVEAALAAGAVKVIAKPISAARLTEALRSLLPESA